MRRCSTRRALSSLERGFEQTTIAEITDTADLGVGSFYNHFGSKEDLLAALLEEALTEQLAALDSRRAGIADPAEAIAIAHRHWVRLTSEGPEWAWLVVRLETSFELVAATQGESALKDLERRHRMRPVPGRQPRARAAGQRRRADLCDAHDAHRT